MAKEKPLPRIAPQDVPRVPPLLFRPRRIVVPLDLALEMSFEGDPLLGFIERRIACGDPGPLEIVDGVASTPTWDCEIARWALCVVLRRRGGLEVAPGRDE